LRHLSLLLLFSISLFATMILNLNVKEKPDRIELILNFDSPYTGTIVKKPAKEGIDLVLKKVKILAPWQKKLSSKLAYQIDAIPEGEDTRISFYTTTKDLLLYAARSKDRYSLKIVLKQKSAPSRQKEEWKIPFGTILKWGGILLGAGALLFLLIRIVPNLSIPKVKKTKRIVIEHPLNEEFKILFEKPLDERNKIALISFKGVDYLVLIGSSNVLLGKYKEGEILTHEDFERAIESQDLEKAMEPKPEDEIFTTIEEYKRRASGDL